MTSFINIMLVTVILFVEISCLIPTIKGATKKTKGFSFDIVRSVSSRSAHHHHHHHRRHHKSHSNSYGLSTTTFTIPQENQYLVKLYLGSQNIPIWAGFGTGVDYSSVICGPCPDCTPSNTTLYYPIDSLSYKNISCSSPQCIASGFSNCTVSNNSCVSTYPQYNFSEVLGTDTLSFEISSSHTEYLSFDPFYFACFFISDIQFFDNVTGFLGLGNGPLSFIHQTEISRFSYCFGDFQAGEIGKLSFGDDAKLSGSNVYKTPLITSPNSIYYNATLLGISIFNHRFNLKKKIGNIFISSGIEFSVLPPSVNNKTLDVVKRYLDCTPVEINPNITFLSTCYDIRNCDLSSLHFWAHFYGADLPLTYRNFFLEVENGVFCWDILSDPGDISFGYIWGNVAQSHYTVGFDLDNHLLSFEHNYRCSP